MRTVTCPNAPLGACRPRAGCVKRAGRTALMLTAATSRANVPILLEPSRGLLANQVKGPYGVFDTRGQRACAVADPGVARRRRLRDPRAGRIRALLGPCPAAAR